MLNKKILVAAVVGGLFAGNALAADLSAPTGAIPSYYAKEIKLPADIVAAGNDSALGWTLNWNFTPGEVKYARVVLTGGIKFDANSVVEIDVQDNGTWSTTQVGAVNGLGTNVLIIPISSGSSATDKLTAASKIRITSSTDGHEVTSYSDVDASVALYDQASQAQAGGSGVGSGLVQGTNFAGPYIRFTESYKLVAKPNVLVADVGNGSATPFVNFVGQATVPATGGVDGTLANSLKIELVDPDGTAGVQTATFGVNGLPVTLPGLLNLATTKIKVNGQYGFAVDLTLDGGTINPAFDEEAAVQGFNGLTNNITAGDKPLVIEAEGTIGIEAGEYYADLAPVSANAAVYGVSPMTNVLAGTIKKNGAELQAPLVQLPDGWISRLVLTNTGSLDRNYSLRVLSEDGVTLTTANLTGTVKKNSTYVINDLNTVLTGTSAGNVRGTIVVNVEAPDAAGTGTIQGLYQIVNPSSGSISNHVLVRPGTN